MWKRFYEALLKVPRLAPKVRNAVMRELGRSPRNESAELTWGVTQVHRAMVNERKALMRTAYGRVGAFMRRPLKRLRTSKAYRLRP